MSEPFIIHLSSYACEQIERGRSIWDFVGDFSDWEEICNRTKRVLIIRDHENQDMDVVEPDDY